MSVDKSVKAALTETIRNLQVSIKSSSLYSINHPTSVKAINTVFAQLQRMFEQKEVVTIQITNGVVFFERTPLDRDNIHVKGFVTELTERNVTGMLFQRKLTMDEFRTFMKIMGMKASKLEETGGINKALSAENIQNIKVQLFSLTSGAHSEADALGGLSMLPEIAAFSNYFMGKEGGLGSFAEKFFRDVVGNPGVMAQVVSKSMSEESMGEHPVVHYLKSLDKIATTFAPRVGDSPEELRKVVVPVALSFDQTIKDTILEEGRQYAANAGKHVSGMYRDIVDEIIADRVRFNYKEGQSKGSDLGDKIQSLLRYAENPKVTVRLIEQKLKESGMNEDEIGDVLDHVYWNEYTLEEKYRRLMYGEKPWTKDFDKIYHTVVELIKSNKESQALTLARAYVLGLRAPDETVKKDVAKNSLKLLSAFPASDTREDLVEYVQGELIGGLRAEPAAQVCEAMLTSLTGIVREDLIRGVYARATDAAGMLEEMLLAFDIQPWKADLIRNAIRGVADQTALTSIIDALHTQERVRDEEVSACIRAFGPNIVDQLIGMLGDESDRVRRARIVEAIQMIGPAAENAILASLNDERWYLVRNLAILLGEIGGERSIFSLEKVLYHRDQRVGRAAIRSLSKIGSATASRVLGRALEKGSEDLRLSVVQAAAAASNEALVPNLLELAKAKPGLGGGEAIRRRAIEALGKIGSMQAVPVLIEILEKRSLFTMAEDVETRIATVRALGSIGSEEAFDALERAARKDPKEDVRTEADRILTEAEGQ